MQKTKVETSVPCMIYAQKSSVAFTAWFSLVTESALIQCWRGLPGGEEWRGPYCRCARIVPKCFSLIPHAKYTQCLQGLPCPFVTVQHFRKQIKSRAWEASSGLVPWLQGPESFTYSYILHPYKHKDTHIF